MEILYTISELRHFLKVRYSHEKCIGLVPTMGAIHLGHKALIKASLLKCDLTICSIFVNPAQFNNLEDLKKYPKRLDSDIQTLEEAGCDVLFLPEASEMYPNADNVSLHFGELETVMEGAFRPGHFSGVGLIVSKFFNIIRPDKSFFGQKDIQQVAVVRKLIKDFDFEVEVEVVDTIREANGLALSSRNLLLSEGEKQVASGLYLGLMKLKSMIDGGSGIEEAIVETKSTLVDQVGIDLEYLNVVNSDTMQHVDCLECNNISICAAAVVGGVRIIDNIYLKRKN